MSERDAIQLAAADWLARLREPDVSLEETLSWQNWMNADARHAQAFARMEAVSSLLSAMPRPSRPCTGSVMFDRYDASVPLDDWQSARRIHRRLAIAASFLVAAATWAWVASTHRWLPWPDAAPGTYHTAVGENRSIELPDTSRVTLGGDTRIEVAYSADSRRIELLRGEAFFTVAKDPARPFKVRAGDATVAAVGTEFNVRRGTDRVIVSVVEGRVIVEPETRILPVVLVREFKPRFVPVSLAAGQQTTADTSGVAAAAPLPDPASATAWQRGRLTFRLEPLRYVLENLNRYTPKPIEIDDDRIGALRVTGTVVSDSVQGWINSLQSALGVEAVEEPDRILLRSATH